MLTQCENLWGQVAQGFIKQEVKATRLLLQHVSNETGINIQEKTYAQTLDTGWLIEGWAKRSVPIIDGCRRSLQA